MLQINMLEYQGILTYKSIDKKSKIQILLWLKLSILFCGALFFCYVTVFAGYG